MQALDLPSARSILECGCGSGMALLELFREKPKEADLFASDISESMLIRAQYRLLRYILAPMDQEVFLLD